MRLVGLSDARKVGAAFFCTVLTGGCAVGPSTAVGQEYIVIIKTDAKNPKNNEIWVGADCTTFKITESTKEQPTSQASQLCVFSRKECEPGKCDFDKDKNSKSEPPFPVTLGVTGYNPTCFWVWDPYRYKYIYICRP